MQWSYFQVDHWMCQTLWLITDKCETWIHIFITYPATNIDCNLLECEFAFLILLFACLLNLVEVSNVHVTCKCCFCCCEIWKKIWDWPIYARVFIIPNSQDYMFTLCWLQIFTIDSDSTPWWTLERFGGAGAGNILWCSCGVLNKLMCDGERIKKEMIRKFWKHIEHIMRCLKQKVVIIRYFIFQINTWTQVATCLSDTY